MAKPYIMQLGVIPDRDIEALESGSILQRSYETGDKAAFVARHAHDIRGAATLGDLGASRDWSSRCLPVLEGIPVGEDAVPDGLETGGLGWAALDMFAGGPRLDARFTRHADELSQPRRAPPPGRCTAPSGGWPPAGRRHNLRAALSPNPYCEAHHAIARHSFCQGFADRGS